MGEKKEEVIDLTSEAEEESEDIPIYPFYLLSTSSSSESYEVNLNDILCGDIKSLLLMNYMYDIPWLVDHCPRLLDPLLDVCCLHGTKGAQSTYKKELLERKLYHWVLSEVDMEQERWGTHHTKMVIAFYDTGVRICIMTANFLECDFVHLSQGIFVQDFPSTTSSVISANSFGHTEFYRPLVEYLQRVLPVSQEARYKLNQYILLLEGFDFSSAAVALVPSVPGKFPSQNQRWGRLRMEYLLRKYNRVPPRENQSHHIADEALVMQVSSIGSLGPNERYLTELKSSLLADKPFMSNPIPIELVWPTVNCIRHSSLGYESGGSMPLYSQIVEENNNLKLGFTKIMRQWIGVTSDRVRFPPHMKCYFRYQTLRNQTDCGETKAATPSLIESEASASHPQKKRRVERTLEEQEQEDEVELLWFLLTSANLSQAAWGVSQKSGQQLYIKSYEMGVLFLPARFSNTLLRSFSCTPLHSKFGSSGKTLTAECSFRLLPQSNNRSSNSSSLLNRLPFPIPFLVPAPKYNSDDRPWIVDKRYLEIDRRGNSWIPGNG